MPSNKNPSYYVQPGPGMPASGGTAAAQATLAALKAHIDDPVGAHAASAISYTAGPDWADGDTNPDADVQVQIDKIITDLGGGPGGLINGTGKIHSFSLDPPWVDAPFSVSANTLSYALNNLLFFTNQPYYYNTVDAGNSPHTLVSTNRDTHLFVDSTTGARTIILPQTPANHLGWTWHIYDMSGNSQDTVISINRYAAAVYTINGYAGNVTIGKRWGHWTITCDGLNFYIEECPGAFAPPPTVATSPYTLDATLPNDLVFVATTAARTLVFPSPANCRGRQWVIVDRYGQSQRYNITFQVPSGTINGYAGNISVGKAFARWVVSCDGSNWLVQEMLGPTLTPPVITGPFTYQLEAASLPNGVVYVDTSAGFAIIILPQFPADHKNQTWFIYDSTGTSETNFIGINRFGTETYKINGDASGSPVVHSPYGLWIITCDGTDYYVHELQTPPSEPYIHNSAVFYRLDSRAANGFHDVDIYVDTTIARQVRLPKYPANHKGQKWYVYDQTGTSDQFPIQFYRGDPYLINGISADLYVQGQFGQWEVTCDGTNFWVHPIRLEGQRNQTTVTTNTYTVDSHGWRDEILFVSTTTFAPTITLPDPAAPGMSGRTLTIIDISGNSEANNIKLHAPAAWVKINGVALVDLPLSANWGHWEAVCRNDYWFVA